MTEAEDINEGGDIVGIGSNWHGFYQPTGGSPIDAGTLGGTNSTFYRVTESGQAVGTVELGAGTFRAGLWMQGTGWTQLGTLGGDDSWAFDIGNDGMVVGMSKLSGEHVIHAFHWLGGGLIDPGTLGYTHSAFRGCNDSGVAVGDVGSEQHLDGYHAFDTSRAVIWIQSDGMRALNDLLPAGSGWVLLTGRDINEHGQVAGVGLLHGARRAYRLTLDR